MKDCDSYERLYLAHNDKNDIYIDLPQLLPQHQLDGIRYLYRQFAKRNPGVILNDPPGYGKCLQVVLFLNAMRPTLNKPILILCNDNTIQNWKEHFEIWTNCFHEVAIQTSNPFANNTVYINSTKDGPSFSRRNWGIVVVHDNHVTREVLQLKFNADYKIWVTSMNLKEDLQKLSLIYEWLHPNCEINLDDFKTEPNNYLDMMTKSLLLDAYLEDFLIRRNDFSPLFEKPQVPEPVKPLVVESPKVSRKNKDPTGTKVKRSKKRRLEDEVANQEAAELNKSINNNDIDNKTNSSNELFNFTNKTRDNVVKFIRNNEPSFKCTKEYTHDNNLHENLIVLKTEDTEESLTLEFENAVNDLVRADNASPREEHLNSSDVNVIAKVSDNFTNSNKQCDTQNSNKSDQFDIPMIEVTTTVPIEILKNGIRDNASVNKINNSPNNEEIVDIQASIEGEKVNNEVIKFSNEKDDTTEFKPEDNNANNENAIKTEGSRELSNFPEAQSVENDELERKLLELEQKVLNRLKGSFLDRIF